MSRLLWEYEVVDLVDKGAIEEDVFLTAQGDRGWNLMSVLQVGSIRRRFYFKRKKVT